MLRYSVHLQGLDFGSHLLDGGGGFVLFEFQLSVGFSKRGHFFLEALLDRLEKLYLRLEHLDAFSLALHLVFACIQLGLEDRNMLIDRVIKLMNFYLP